MPTGCWVTFPRDITIFYVLFFFSLTLPAWFWLLFSICVFLCPLWFPCVAVPQFVLREEWNSLILTARAPLLHLYKWHVVNFFHSFIIVFYVVTLSLLSIQWHFFLVCLCLVLLFYLMSVLPPGAASLSPSTCQSVAVFCFCRHVPSHVTYHLLVCVCPAISVTHLIPILNNHTDYLSPAGAILLWQIVGWWFLNCALTPWVYLLYV